VTAPAGDISIRPYAAADRAAVRHICFVTGYMGEPVAWAWRDEESFADLWSSYYTDREPESAYVAVEGTRVVGYLLGCRATARVGHPLAPLGRHLLRRGLLFRPGTAGVLWRSLGDLAIAAARRDLPRADPPDPRWPAHLHIDLLPEARGTGVGTQLMRTWLDRLRVEGIPGCHLGTYAENAPAIAFFEAMGFRRHGPPQLAPGMRSPTGERHHSQFLVQELGVAQ